MTNALQMLLSFALTASSVTLSALLLTYCLRSRISARSLYLTWCIVLLCALFPLRPVSAHPTLTLSAAPLERAAVTPVFSVSQPAPTQTPLAAPEKSVSVSALSAAAPSAAQSLSSAPLIADNRQPSVSIGSALLAVYLTGAAITLALQLLRHARYMHLIRRWRMPAQERRLLSVYEDVCSEMGLRRRPQLMLCRIVDSPLLTGLMHPVILLPDSTLNLQELRLILRHELTHYRRGDLYIKGFMLLCVSLHWYNPLIYRLRRELNYACEASCDESVVRGADLDARQYYSETIIAVIRRQSRLRTALSTSFYGGKKEMKNRISTIMDTHARRLGALLLVPVLLLSIVFCVAFASEPDSIVSSAESPSIASLFESSDADHPLTREQAQQIALDLYCRVRNSGQPLDKPYRFADYQIGEYVFGTTMLEAAYVDISIDFGDGFREDTFYRAYIAPLTGTPLSLRSVSGSVEAFPYWQNDTLLFNAETEALSASLPRAAYVNNAVSASANICLITTDYDWPQGTYMNGTPVTVLEVDPMFNNAREVTDAQIIYWARIEVGKTAKSEGVVGWTPLCTLTFADQMIGDLASWPAGTIRTQNGTGYTSVFSECSSTGSVVATLGQGETVQIMGMFAEFYHVVTAQGEAGFLLRSDVALDESTALLMDSIAPANYDQIQPGQHDRYEEYMALLSQYYDLYGDSNEFPLEVAAQVSQLRLSYGFDTGLNVSTLPDENDIPQEEARAFADQRISELYGMNPGDYSSCLVSFYYEPSNPDTRIWKFYYVAVPGKKNCAVFFDQQYNIVRDYQSETVRSALMTEAEREEMLATSPLDYYLSYGAPIEGEVSAQLLKLADERFVACYPEAGDLSGYERTSQVYMDASGHDSELQWAIVTYTRQSVLPSDAKLEFNVVFVSLDPEQMLSTDSECYVSMLQDEWQLIRLKELELVRGPFYTWTVAEKAEFDPDFYSLPDTGAISQEEALIAAKAALRSEGLTENDIALYNAFFSYTDYDDYRGTVRCWRIDFYTAQAMNSALLDGYIVFIDPFTSAVISVWAPGGNG